MSGRPLSSPAMRGRWLHPLIVVGVCAAVYWPMLGASGFSSTEGHRVIPAWTMLESGDWLRVTMFELGYLRKPPGMPWAVAASSAVLGQTEFAARAVSAAAATLSALLCYGFAARWFGRPWGLAAGLACALMPQFWSVGRAAEIEALNNLATLGAAVLLVEILLPAEGRRRAQDAALVAAAGACMALTALAKGPASLPVLAALPGAACLVTRSIRPLTRPALWASAAVAGLVLALLGRLIVGANAGEETVRQGVSDFLWRPELVTDILLLAPAAFGAALPASLALLLPLGRAEETGSEAQRARIARTLAWGWVLALAVYTAAGVANSRYAMPAAVLLPMVAAQAVRVGLTGGGVSRRLRMVRWTFARWRGAVVAAVLLVGAAVFVPMSERQRARASGEEAGAQLAAAIGADRAGSGGEVVVWADEMIETRPEVLLYAVRGAAGAGWTMRPVWAKHELGAGALPPPGAYVLAKTSGAGVEMARLSGAIGDGRLAPVASGSVHKFEFALYRRTGR